jgi:hypothetical protein
MSKIGVEELEAKELLAIALYKYKGIHGSLAGKGNIALCASGVEFRLDLGYKNKKPVGCK